MDFKELVILAVDALRSNVVRTMLTMLGIVIGIASVITIVALGEGATASVVDKVNSFGVNLVTVSPSKFQRGIGGGGGSSETLTMDDAETIGKLYGVETVSGVMSKTKSLTVGSEEITSSVQGVEASYGQVKQINLLEGVFFTESQVRSMSRVVVLGESVVEDFWGEDSSGTGKTIRIDGKSFRVVGVIEGSKEVLIPLDLAQKVMFGQDFLNSINVLVIDGGLMEEVTISIEQSLLNNHDISNIEKADFEVNSSEEMLETVNAMTGVLTTMLSGIAGISLLVGGIGIMNIMLVTVTERTREIGLLKAIGAKSKDILTQFLIESVVLTLIGGVIGLLLGIGLSYIASGMMEIPFVMSTKAIILAISVSVGVGILFGWYPASRASKLNPIDALRFE